MEQAEKLEVAQLRRLMGERINMARRAVVADVLIGDDKAIRAWIQLNDQESKLFGLNEPDKVVFEFDAELITALEILGADASVAFEQFRQMALAKANEKRNAVYAQ
jgi:hypothetical protein